MIIRFQAASLCVDITFIAVISRLQEPCMLHIIQNDPAVPPGIIEQILTVPFCVHHPYRGERLPDPRDISALIVLGGTMGANDEKGHPFLHDVKVCIGEVVARDIPYLGICLGAQLLAAVQGGRVVSGRWGEMGSHDIVLTAEGKGDPLFRGLQAGFTTFQWHNDSFDIPENGVLLARSAACPHQAFRAGGCAWGLQFHPEITERIVRDWCDLENAGSVNYLELLRSFNSRAREYHFVAEMLFGNFVKLAGM